MRLSVSTEGVTIKAEEAGAAAPEAAAEASGQPPPAASTNGAGPEEEGGIRNLIKSLSGKLAGGDASNGAAKTAPAAVEKVIAHCSSRLLPSLRVQK